MVLILSYISENYIYFYLLGMFPQHLNIFPHTKTLEYMYILEGFKLLILLYFSYMCFLSILTAVSTYIFLMLNHRVNIFHSVFYSIKTLLNINVFINFKPKCYSTFNVFHSISIIMKICKSFHYRKS